MGWGGGGVRLGGMVGVCWMTAMQADDGYAGRYPGVCVGEGGRKGGQCRQIPWRVSGVYRMCVPWCVMPQTEHVGEVRVTPG